jgi:UMF1 family MFS transporter
MRFSRKKLRGGLLILSWASYDLANQFFALNIVSLYFPYWLTIQKKSPEIFYSLSFGVSMCLVAICAPILGVISDMGARRRSFLIFFTLLSVIFTMAMGLSSNIFLGLVFFAIANFGCQGAIIFYNALMVRVAPKERIGLVSGLGRMFGYGGALLALYLTKPIIVNLGYQATFLITGILFLIFSLPCLIFIKDAPSKERIPITYFLQKERLLQIFRRLKVTIFDSSEFEELRKFLKAIFFGLCVVNTIILFMAVYAAKVFELTQLQIIDLIAFCAIFAMGGSIFSGFISDIFGYRKSLIGVFFLWGICLLGGGLLSPPLHWLVGALAGVALGSTWVIARAIVIKLTPHQKLGEVFGIFNLVSYASGIVGPLFWGAMLLCLSSLGQWGYRLAFLSLISFMAIGFVFLLRMPKKAI